jgi:carbonic anhydrase
MRIRDGYQQFRSSVLPEQSDLFRRLEGGQHPEVLFITCSDSRIDPALITQTLPGELFVIRNAGNLVPTRKGSGEAGTIEYGVRGLGVKHIVVCGHSHCGAVSAALSPESLDGLPFVAAWLREAGPDVSALDESAEDRVMAAVELNVRQQLERLRKLPAVAEATQAGKLQLHGWVYRFESGEILELDATASRFVSLNASHNAGKSLGNGISS